MTSKGGAPPLGSTQRPRREGARWDAGDPSGFVVGWGTLALINAGLAQGRNRSGLNWFLLSLLLGPIATFFHVVFTPKFDTKAGGDSPPAVKTG